MPYRRLPNTDQARVRALKAAVEKGEMYNVRDLAITLKTLFEARNFLHRFEAAQIYYTQCYDNQSRASRKHQMNVKTARLYISHFIQVYLRRRSAPTLIFSFSAVLGKYTPF